MVAERVVILRDLIRVDSHAAGGRGRQCRSEAGAGAA